jgi:hypothetical protein
MTRSIPAFQSAAVRWQRANDRPGHEHQYLQPRSHPQRWLADALGLATRPFTANIYACRQGLCEPSQRRRNLCPAALAGGNKLLPSPISKGVAPVIRIGSNTAYPPEERPAVIQEDHHLSRSWWITPFGLSRIYEEPTDGDREDGAQAKVCHPVC